MIKISIIVPVYNAQIHLEKCITSLLAQTIDEVEFIFINDGSTDDSQKK
jgi:glycosyltransferase involved in cell wall biosynthesis